MDKNAIKKYAVWARNELISRVAQKADQYGITEAEIISASEDSIYGRLLTPAEKKQRTALIERIKTKGYKQVIEEVAYTWFNRLTAIRFMEVNGYLPSHVRVFTDEENRFAPQILAEAIHLDMPGLNMDKVFELKQANKTEELYKYLIITQCNALNEILPGMFQKIEDYTELLLPDNLLREGSVIEQMITLIPEEDWTDQVQIIGWLYQFYNIEPKAAVFAKNGKVTKEEIPAATQLFTPDWIVRYMVENSLGRLWVEGHPNDELKSTWKYYLEEAEQEDSVQAQLETIRKEYAGIKPEEIKVIDPCMGSGHILCYMFDVLVQIYEAYGYTARDAASLIVENNIYGLDIDNRASQLAYFAVMMKARQYDRRFFSRGIKPNVYAIVESNSITNDVIEYFVNGDEALKNEISIIIKEMRDAKEYGSVLNISNVNFDLLYARFDEIFDDVSLFRQGALDELLPVVKVAQILAQKYDATITNPPYMPVSNLGAKAADYVIKTYPDSKSDLFAVFIEKCNSMLKSNGFQAMITMHSWMFLASYEELRYKLNRKNVVNLVHLGARAFEEISGEVVQAVAFVISNKYVNKFKGVYSRLTTQHGQQEKELAFLEKKNNYIATQDAYAQIPGAPFAYWWSKSVYDCFCEKQFVKGNPMKGIQTGKGEKYLRYWHEVSIHNTGFDLHSHQEMVKSGLRWFPLTSGGLSRKWYGNYELVVNLKNDGADIRATGLKNFRLKDPQYYFLEGLTWTEVTTKPFTCRYLPSTILFGNGGPVAFQLGNKLNYTIGLLNSVVARELFTVLAPTMNYGPDQVRNVPYKQDNEESINEFVSECIELSKLDWDAFETSWDFEIHPFVKYANSLWDATAIGATMSKFYGRDLPKHNSPIELCYLLWQGECADRFATLKANEEELNRLFIDIYGLNDELSPEVADKDVTVRKADLGRDIRSFISYAVGCMFGRYSLNVDGIAYAGGEWNDEKYISFKADKDNVLPICDDEYFEDDIVGKFVKFVEVVFGKDTLEENLKFIADALGGSGSPRDVIRSYFLNDFYADHLKVYQKRPIYWQFDSGKKNGFKCLVYMHRYQPDTIARIRTDYVHEQQARYRTAIADLEQRIQVATTSERVKLTKLLQKLQDQETEIRLFEEKIHHLADQMIRIDLDDGVKHNYEIFGDVLTKLK